VDPSVVHTQDPEAPKSSDLVDDIVKIVPFKFVPPDSDRPESLRESHVLRGKRTVWTSMGEFGVEESDDCLEDCNHMAKEGLMDVGSEYFIDREFPTNVQLKSFWQSLTFNEKYQVVTGSLVIIIAIAMLMFQNL
jgi:hypothetical protein